MIRITFAGHSRIYCSGIREQIKAAIEPILEKDSVFYFYSGGMGAFDWLCEGVVQQLKVIHKELDIHLVLVAPYMSNRFNTEREEYAERYDDILVPIELARCHPKGAIPKRNRWMIDHADYLIAYVSWNHGGAYNTLQYATRRAKKGLIHICKLE